MKANTNTRTRATRVAAAVDHLLAGQQRQKVVLELKGRSAEQWAELVAKGAAVGLSADAVAGLLIHLTFAALAAELEGRPKTKAKATATATATAR
jgi:hypothetical protein